jgi:ankyrin repeat protein
MPRRRMPQRPTLGAAVGVRRRGAGQVSSLATMIAQQLLLSVGADTVVPILAFAERAAETAEGIALRLRCVGWLRQVGTVCLCLLCATAGSSRSCVCFAFLRGRKLWRLPLLAVRGPAALQVDDESFVQLMRCAEASALEIKTVLDLVHARVQTPLALAIKIERAEVVRALLSSAGTLSHEAAVGAAEAAIGCSTTEFLSMLIAHAGLDLAVEIPDNRTQMRKGTTSIAHLAVRLQKPAHLELMLQHHQPLARRADSTGRMPLHVAAHAGNAELVRILLDFGASPTDRDSAGNTSLHLTTTEACTTALVLAQRAHAPAQAAIDLQNAQGRTPLANACAHGFHGVAVRLLELAACPVITDAAKATPLHLALTAVNGSEALRVIERIVDQFVNPAEPQSQPQPHGAVSHGGAWRKMPVETFLNMRDELGETALHKATDRAVIRFLLEHSAQPLMTNSCGATPLHTICAAWRSGRGRPTTDELTVSDHYQAVVQLLKRHGALMDAADLAGDTPLHAAIREAHSADAEAICGALVLEGASLYIENQQRVTQLQLAIDRSRKVPNSPLLQTLLRHSVMQAPMVDDSAARACQECNAPFTIKTRRHHCRHCGRLVCASCSMNKLPIAKFSMPKPVRVCLVCFDALKL